MKTCAEYLDSVKAKKHFSSDYQLAKFLGESPTRLSNYRTRGSAFDDEMAVKVADVLGIDPMEVIIAANLQRAKRPEQKEFWQRVGQRFSALLLTVSIGLISFSVTTPQPVQAADSVQSFTIMLNNIQCWECS